MHALGGDDVGRISPAPVTTAAQVSSREVSIPEDEGGSVGGHRSHRAPQQADRVGDVVQRALQGRGRAPHDQGVLAVVLVVAAAQAGSAEAVALVQRDGAPRWSARTSSVKRARRPRRRVRTSAASSAVARCRCAGGSGAIATFMMCHTVS